MEKVAERLVTHGKVPIYDHWWMRASDRDDDESARAELRAGLRHADSFVHFESTAARQSRFVDFECAEAEWLTFSDNPGLRMIRVLLDDAESRPRLTYHVTIDATTHPGDTDSLARLVVEALGDSRNEDVIPEVSRCRVLAQASDDAQLLAELENSFPRARLEASILLAFRKDVIESPAIVRVLHELDQGLRGRDVERVLLALGRLAESARPLVPALARLIESDAEDRTRARAVRALGRIGPYEEVISALIHAATTPSRVQGAAITELGHFGSAAGLAITPLIKLAEAPPNHLRLVALTALGNIGDNGKEVLVTVLKALAETEGRGLDPSQLHYNAMCVMNLLDPDDLVLAMAILAAHRESYLFSEWLKDSIPEVDATIRLGIQGQQLKDTLIQAGRRVRGICRAEGARRPI